MAQYVHIEMEYEPGEGIPRSFNHREGVEGRMVLHHTAETTHEAVLFILQELDDAGVHIDGPLTITAKKERQIGGDDGVRLDISEGKAVLHVTAPNEGSRE